MSEVMRARALRPTAGRDFNAYYDVYIAKIADGDIVETLRAQGASFDAFLGDWVATKWDYAYAPGKWTVAESALHVLDTERVFAYRALRIGRGDPTALPGFDQDVFVPHSGANARSVESLRAEWCALRASTVSLFEGFPAAAWSRVGEASGNALMAGACAWIVAGHCEHHVRVFEAKYR
ncbi:MAG: DinB family protein [Gemmatimonadaceae bacterium]|nr:DinB family protein [Gemmatimonadaceae bacterium]